MRNDQFERKIRKSNVLTVKKNITFAFGSIIPHDGPLVDMCFNTYQFGTNHMQKYTAISERIIWHLFDRDANCAFIKVTAARKYNQYYVFKWWNSNFDSTV